MKTGKQLEISIDGDIPEGNLLVSIPMMVNNIASIETTGKVVDKALNEGQVWFSADTKSLIIHLKE